MGLFARVRGAAADDPPQAATARALLAMPLLVAAAEGRTGPADLAGLAALCAASPAVAALGPDGAAGALAAHLDRLRRAGAEALFAGANARLTPPLRETAFCLAVRAALARGRAGEAALATLRRLAERLELSPATVRAVLEVMAMLHRPAAG